jgi:hypothetical protein
MSDRTDNFFGWVWRLNGLLVLLLALLGLAAAVTIVINVGIFASRERPEQKLTQVAGADLQNLRIADFQPIQGTDVLYAPLAASSEYIGSGSSGGLGSARNLLFFDTATKRAHWLFSGNGQVIPSFSFLTDPPSVRFGFDDDIRNRPDPVTIAILLEVQRSAAGEEEIPETPHSLAVATPDGRSVTTIADATEGMLGYHQVNKNSILVFYVSAGSARVLDLDPIAHTVRSDDLLSSSGPGGSLPN